MTYSKENVLGFRRLLMDWHKNQNRRVMPWKGETDPYKIWLSEIILQQTRVEQGVQYYMRFINTFPTVQDLAHAQDQVVFKMWEGLGYYSRCRNLLATARTICSEFGGKFPADHQLLLKLKGVGPYTAAAIASFAYGLPHAVVDGNVIRVLSRYFLLDEVYDIPAGRKKFEQLARDCLDPQDAGTYNQAIMDFGATVCKPRDPACPQCPLRAGCKAYIKGMETELPNRKLKPEKDKRSFVYLILTCNGKVWIKERNEKDIWRHLYEFYLVELADKHALEGFDPSQYMIGMGLEPKSVMPLPRTFRQTLTHQVIQSRFFIVALYEPVEVAPEGRWVPLKSISKFPFPKTLNEAMVEWGRTPAKQHGGI
ncbi:MAG TPA: A/G-specific adenine glycosylase [Phnomibacter sp.]|nr:A/G-specific adenine glycosylase [Phnomibacter sp.]